MARRSQDRIRGYLYKTKDDLTHSNIYKSNKIAREIIDSLLTIFKHLLTEMDFFSSYFNRQCENRHTMVLVDDQDEIDATKETPRKKVRKNIHLIMEKTDLNQRLCVSLCNKDGEFKCQGYWDQVLCNYEDHSINPYASRENAILFQIWNLDHRIEISRSIIPSILANVCDLAKAAAGQSSPVKCTKHKRAGKCVSVIQFFMEIFTVENLKLVHIVCHDKGVHNLQSEGRILCDRCAEYKFIQKLLQAIKN